MQQFTLYNGTEQMEVYSDHELGHITKMCTNQTELFLLNANADLFTGTIDLHLKSSQQPIINLILLRSAIVDIDCTTDSLYVVHQNGCVYRKYLIDLQQTNADDEWKEIIVQNPKTCVHGYRSLTDKILIARINCNADGILFTSLKRELFAMGNFGDVVRSEIPVPVECFSGFKIMQISTGEHFAVVLTHKKPHIDTTPAEDYSSSNEGSGSNDSSIYINAECVQCAPTTILSDGIYKSTTETSIASSASQSDVFEDGDYDNSSIVTIDQTTTESTTALSHKDVALNFLLESLSIASEDAGKQTKLLKENVSNLTLMVRKSVRTFSRHMSGSSDTNEALDLTTDTVSLCQTVETDDENKSINFPMTSELDITSHAIDCPDSFCEDLSLDIESVVDLQYEFDVEKNVTKLCRTGAGLLNTSVWCFGSVNNGHLGTGDHIKRTRINSVLGLNGQGVVKICSGKEHSMAMTLDGRVFNWGLNDHQQIHPSTEIEYISAPRKYRSQYNVLDVVCGNYSTYMLSNDMHTIELRSKQNRDDNRSKTFITLKSNKKLNSPLTAIDRSTIKIPMFLASGNMYVQNHIHIGIIEKYLTFEQKCLQDTLACYLTITKPFMKKIYLISPPKNHVFDQLCQQYLNILNISAVNVNTMLEYYTNTQSHPITNILCIKNATEMIIAYRAFVRALCDIICIHGFRLINKMLDGDDTKPMPKNRAKWFGRPILSIPNYIEMIADVQSMINDDNCLTTASVSEMRQFLDDRKTEWERFNSEKDSLIECAEKTSKFWDTVCVSPKHPMVKLQTSDRRLILDSKEISLKLLPSGRFSTHWFVLFNDSFCHFCSNTMELYHLKTIWTTSLVDNDTRKNLFKVITPEKHFILQTQLHENKLKWLDAIDRKVKQCLDKQNFVKMPQYRNASYTFADKHSKYPNAKYFGRWHIGQMHGIGHLEYDDGRVYNGQMIQGDVQGFGRMYTPGIGIYEGDFVAGKYHGYGVLEMRNRGTYEGNFKDGMQHGHGVLRADNFMYIGEFRADIMHGYGVLDNSDTGDKYLGMFCDNKRHGHGILITMDGNYFEGNFSGDKLCGDGVAVFENCSYYEGDLTFLGPDGKGSLFLPNSVVKNESLEVEYRNIEMTGNILSGNLSGTWNDVKINNGNIAMNQSFPVIPKSLGLQSIDNAQKWKSLFSDWETDVFGVDNNFDYKQYWNKVAIYITNTKRRQTLKSEGFSESKQQNGPWSSSSTDNLAAHNKTVNIIENLEIVSMIKNAGITTKKLTTEKPSLSHNHNNNNNLVVGHNHNNNNNLNGTKLYDNLKNEANLLDIFKSKKELLSTQNYQSSNCPLTDDHITTKLPRRKSIIDNLDYVPDFGVTKLDKQDLELVKDYLTKAFRDPSHPFGVLNSRISFCFYTSYGCWKSKPKSIVLPLAMKEWQHISQRIYGIVRKLFPALPIDRDYCDGEMISHQSLMYPILLSDGIYSTLFVLYASKCCQNDELYRQRIMICDKKTDDELATFLKMDKSLLSLINSTQFDETLCCLKQVKEKNCPREMLNQIECTFKLLTNAKNNVLGNFNMLNADNIMPLTIFLILRAGIPHLGAELLLLEDLMGIEFETIMLGYAGYCFATIKATYQHILSDNFLQD